MNRLVLGLSVAVVIAAVADLWMTIRGGRTPVPAEVMQKAVDRIQAVRKSGDLVVHSPLLTVKELAPLGKLVARPDRPKEILRSRRRLVVLDFAATSMFGLGEPASEEALGAGLVLRTYPPSGAASGALWELASNLAPTTMTVERGSSSRTCTRDRREGGYSCPGEPEWLYASVRSLKVGRKQRECVWAHPTTNGTIVLMVPAQPEAAPDHRLQLRLQAGLVDDAVVNTPDGAAVSTEVVQGRRTLGRLTVANRIGWFKEQFELAPGQPAQLRITTPRDGRRHFCVDAQVVEVK